MVHVGAVPMSVPDPPVAVLVQMPAGDLWVAVPVVAVVMSVPVGVLHRLVLVLVLVTLGVQKPERCRHQR